MRFDVLEPPRTNVKNSIHLALSNIIHLRRFDEVRNASTTPNLCDKTLHTSLSLIACFWRRFDEV